MRKRTNKRMRKARGSLGKMMEMLRPYLPKKQAVAPETVQKWKLPEDHYPNPEEKKRRRNLSAL
jgi:hypothetical protein